MFVFLQTPKRYHASQTYSYLYMITKYITVPYIYDQTDSGECVLDKAGGKQHNITEAATNELKLGEGG